MTTGANSLERCYDGGVSANRSPDDSSGADADVRVINGPNHVITLRDGYVHCRVFPRPDTDLASGARFAGNLVDTLIEMLELPEDQVAYCVLNVCEAPGIAGPKTRAAVARLAEVWEQARRPLLAVVGDEAIKDVQFHGLMTEHAPSHGRRVFTEEEAHATARRMMRRSIVG